MTTHLVSGQEGFGQAVVRPAVESGVLDSSVVGVVGYWGRMLRTVDRTDTEWGLASGQSVTSGVGMVKPTSPARERRAFRVQEVARPAAPAPASYAADSIFSLASCAKRMRSRSSSLQTR